MGWPEAGRGTQRPTDWSRWEGAACRSAIVVVLIPRGRGQRGVVRANREGWRPGAASSAPTNHSRWPCSRWDVAFLGARPGLGGRWFAAAPPTLAIRDYACWTRPAGLTGASPDLPRIPAMGTALTGDTRTRSRLPNALGSAVVLVEARTGKRWRWSPVPTGARSVPPAAGASGPSRTPPVTAC
jgi:hypothetical protein